MTLSMRGMKGSNNGSPVTPVSNTRTRSNSSSETSLSHRAHALIDSPDAAGSGRSATFRHMGPLGMVMQDQGFHMPLGASMLHHAYSSPDQLHGNLLGDLPHVHMGMVRRTSPRWLHVCMSFRFRGDQHLPSDAQCGIFMRAVLVRCRLG